MLTLAAVLVIGILRPTPCEAARKSTPNAEGSGGQDSKAPPHLVVVVGDDFGTYDGASYRGGKIHTPVLDGLVKQGNSLHAFTVSSVSFFARFAMPFPLPLSPSSGSSGCNAHSDA